MASPLPRPRGDSVCLSGSLCLGSYTMSIFAEYPMPPPSNKTNWTRSFPTVMTFFRANCFGIIASLLSARITRIDLPPYCHFNVGQGRETAMHFVCKCRDQGEIPIVALRRRVLFLHCGRGYGKRFRLIPPRPPITNDSFTPRSSARCPMAEVADDSTYTQSVLYGTNGI